jgi:hypothetical protein
MDFQDAQDRNRLKIILLILLISGSRSPRPVKEQRLLDIVINLDRILWIFKMYRIGIA